MGNLPVPNTESEIQETCMCGSISGVWMFVASDEHQKFGKDREGEWEVHQHEKDSEDYEYQNGTSLGSRKEREGHWMCSCESNSTGGSTLLRNQSDHHETKPVPKSEKNCTCGSISGVWMFADIPDYGKVGNDGDVHDGEHNVKEKDESSKKALIFAVGSVAGGVLVALVFFACWRWRAAVYKSSKLNAQSGQAVMHAVVGVPVKGTEDLELGTGNPTKA